MSPMNPRLLRPTTSLHPEAANWQGRVIANGGTVGGLTLRAVSQFCRQIDSAGIRDRFFRLNLFCGDNLSAALVPLYRAESRTASVRGNTTDTNNNFVAADFNNTGSASGLKGNGSTKSLVTGVSGNSLTANNTHLAVGLAATESANAFKSLIAMVDNSSAVGFEFYARRTGGFGNGAAGFGVATTESQRFGDNVVTATLAAGRLIAAWPSLYRNGAASGTTATGSTNTTSSLAIAVFAANQTAQGIVNHTEARLNFYSIGLTMTASQAAAYDAALAAFNTALSRT